MQRFIAGVSTADQTGAHQERDTRLRQEGWLQKSSGSGRKSPPGQSRIETTPQKVRKWLLAHKPLLMAFVSNEDGQIDDSEIDSALAMTCSGPAS
jgi:hypothetical protein